MEYYAISRALANPLEFVTGTFVLQYEVKLQEGLDCGGAYIKLFRAPLGSSSYSVFHPDRVNDKSPFTIMFGPDRCGSSDKVNPIFHSLKTLLGSFHHSIFESHYAESGGEASKESSNDQEHKIVIAVHFNNSSRWYV